MLEPVQGALCADHSAALTRKASLSADLLTGSDGCLRLHVARRERVLAIKSPDRALALVPGWLAAAEALGALKAE